MSNNNNLSAPQAEWLLAIIQALVSRILFTTPFQKHSKGIPLSPRFEQGVDCCLVVASYALLESVVLHCPFKSSREASSSLALRLKRGDRYCGGGRA